MQCEDGTMVEADVAVNGKPLTFAQSMVLRVAVSSFLMSCTATELGEIGPLYAARSREILKLLITDLARQRGDVVVPRLEDVDLGTAREVQRLEDALRWIGKNFTSVESLQDHVSRALRGKSLP